MKKFISFLLCSATLWLSPSFVFAENKILQTQDSNFKEIKVQMIECKRKGDVLTIKLNFYNPSDRESEACICDDNGGYWRFYVIAGDKKYFILKDDKGAPLAPIYEGIAQRFKIAPKGSHKWWGKFPAPPKEIKSITFIMPEVMPFEDIPITDE